jgi:phosphohistidine phosphatase SixA
VIYLVRHAHAGDKHEWNAPDELRPLTPSGWNDAAGLLTTLGDVSLDAVVSSPAIRCMQTVRDLAQQRGLPIRGDRRLARDARIGHALTLIGELADTHAVVCSHGELIGALLFRLREQGVPVPRGADSAKGSAWVLGTKGGAVVSAQYLPPLRTNHPAARSERPPIGRSESGRSHREGRQARVSQARLPSPAARQ